MVRKYPQLPLSDTLGERVYHLLASKQSLPEKGMVAGQAVASAIDEIFGTGPAIYNDIDDFVETTDWTAVTGDETLVSRLPDALTLSSTVLQGSGSQLEIEDYSLALVIINKDTYRFIQQGEDRGDCRCDRCVQSHRSCTIDGTFPECLRRVWKNNSEKHADWKEATTYIEMATSCFLSGVCTFDALSRDCCERC
ncbi:hypothetical protein BZM27_40485 [Paraburkholderia steynii]|uniref:Uncharacterized protein n=1 Tax=Paraburkholderia steynii TaxID=1245441 RepID=A0A4R0XBZ5_9BURK|nr:hypothetical protein BZM27_40485 [Paraburkholderia steynii]